jgi:type VI secretion system protein ImpL
VAGVLGPLAGSSKALVRTQASGELAQLYGGEVVAECNAIVAGRYPFARGAAGDVPVADFARLFGYGGVYDAFFKAKLAPLVDTTRSPWRWRTTGDESAGLPAAIPAQFEAVERIRQQYFRQGAADPEVRFTLMPENLDADVRRFVLEAGGQSFEYAHGPQAPWALKWPTDAAQPVVATFDTGAGPGDSLVFEGPWAIFRLLDAASLTAASEVRHRVRLGAGGHSAELMLEASSIRNPFSNPAIARFRCGG